MVLEDRLAQLVTFDGELGGFGDSGTQGPVTAAAGPDGDDGSGWGYASFQIVQAIARRAQRWPIVLPEYCDGGGGLIFDGRCISGQRHHLPPIEQPNEADAVVSRQPALARMRLLGLLVQAEQGAGGPVGC